MEIGPKATALGRRRNFVVTKFDLGGRHMKVATINIISVKIHTPEPLRPATGSYSGEKAAAVTTITTGYTTVKYPVSVKFFEAPAPYPLNGEAFRVVVPYPMDKTPGCPLSTLK